MSYDERIEDIPDVPAFPVDLPDGTYTGYVCATRAYTITQGALTGTLCGVIGLRVMGGDMRGNVQEKQWKVMPDATKFIKADVLRLGVNPVDLGFETIGGFLRGGMGHLLGKVVEFKVVRKASANNPEKTYVNVWIQQLLHEDIPADLLAMDAPRGDAPRGDAPVPIAQRQAASDMPDITDPFADQ
jgi:hypothetical protein